LSEPYDDGGISGGSLERPALKRLMADVAEGRVDRIVVYKIDRLTRSLSDFAKIVDVLDAAGASFVSVTQSFNAATSMGRLTLNMLLSFAQFEREVTAERIRDKIAASKRKGLWMGGLVPLGYDPDGRTLKINEREAETVRKLYDLYEQLGTIRAVKAQADRLGLHSRQRERSDGAVSGGKSFDRGHIHHILTNPLYAGRIRHQGEVHAGQHPPIIEPDRWEAVHAQLRGGAARQRRKAAGTRRSALCGRFFDETGDRLTPSHSKTRAGTRLRYYVSHRLVKLGGQPHPDAWRLPAQELETRIARLVSVELSKVGLAATLLTAASADTIANAAKALAAIAANADTASRLRLVDRIDLAPGALTLKLDADLIAERLALAAGDLDAERLVSRHPFQLRKRGGETKITLADAPTGQDATLIRNIARAHVWLERIEAGESFAKIAEADGTSKRRVQQMIDLAFLAPDIVAAILNGTQPLGMTSDWCKSNELPADWAEQRAVIRTL